MGWKSTIDITKQEALSLIMIRLLVASNEELADAVESLGYGDNSNLKYHGHNFMVVDELPFDDEQFDNTK